MEEVWKEIEGYEGLYEVSNFGRIKRLPKIVINSNGKSLLVAGKLLSLRPVAHLGYVLVSLCKDGKATKLYLHRLVAQVFIPNPDNLPVINHKDGNKVNNHIDNLEWCSRAHNVKHAYETGLMDNSGGKHYKARAVVNCRGEEFPTAVEAARAYGVVNYTNVWRVCKRLGKTSGNYSDGTRIHWEYKDQK